MLARFYNIMPSLIQDAIVTLQGRKIKKSRFGNLFNSRLADFINSDYYDEYTLNAFKILRRAETLQRASKTAYYTQLFHEMKSEWRDFVDPKSFSELPILNKSILRDNINSFLCREITDNDKWASTSGTSGAPFKFPISAEVEPDQWAVWWRYRMRHGITFGQRCGLFSSSPVPIIAPNDRSRPYRLNKAGNEIRFSVFHISEDRIKDYISAFEKYNIKWVHGNPASIAEFCRAYINSKYFKPIDIDHLTIGSANLNKSYVNLMKLVFGITPIQHYGQVEGVANFSELPNGSLAVDEDYSYVEFIDYDKCGLKRIIGTSFSNKLFSFLRYDTGDLCELSPDSGKDDVQRFVYSLDGRSTEYVQLPGGRRVASLARPFEVIAGISEAQIVQKRDLSITVKYVTNNKWRGVDEINILKDELRKRLGNEISIEFEEVFYIEKTNRGKSRLVISELKNN